MLELSVRSMSVPLAQVSLDLHGLLVEANMMMMGAAANNAVSAANNVNATLGNAIQQLRITVDTLKETVNDVCTIAHRERVDLNSLYKAVANLDNLLGGAKMTATSVELTPLAYQLDDAAASIRANESGVEADQLAGRLVKAATSMLPLHRQCWCHVAGAQQILQYFAQCKLWFVCIFVHMLLHPVCRAFVSCKTATCNPQKPLCMPISCASCAGLRDTSSSISVTATLENAQRIVSKIPATAANEEDIAPLLQEFEELTAQLQAELDKLSAVTKNISPSSL